MQKAHDSSYNDYWRNYPNINTPIVQDQLNRMETTMDTIDDRVVTFDTTKANQMDLLADINNVVFDSSTGTFTFTKQNGTTIVIDTDIEKIAINFDYDDDPTSAHYQSLIITLDDGTVKYVDMSALITEYEFTDSSVIHFSITSGVISATIIDGSITADKLQPNFLADCVAAKEAAETAETHAETSEDNALAYQYTAEAWARGTKNNVPVTPTDAQYHDNSYYWAQQARAIVGDKVDSFNGRIGTVVAEDGDYESGMLVPTSAQVGQVPVVRNVGTGQNVKLRYVNEDYQSGILPHIIITSDTGSTVSLTKGTNVIYASETSTGHFEADVTEFGTWTIDSVLSGDDAQASLTVDTVTIYTVDVSHFHADITVSFPSDATCSLSKDGTTVYASSTPYTFTVGEMGSYICTITLSDGIILTRTVNATTSGQTFTLDGNVYGIKRSQTTTNSEWERTDTSKNFTFSASVGSTAGASDFDSYAPYSGIERVTKNGDTLVKIPKFYFLRQVVDGVEYIKVMPEEWNGVSLHPAFNKGGTEYDQIYVGAYHTASGYVSQTGKAPLVSQTRATYRTGSKKSTGYYQWDKATHDAITMLILVEVADWDVQDVIGRGYVDANPSVLNSGSCDSVPNLTGRPSGTDGKTGVVWRGLENLWGNLWQFVDGFNFNNGAYYFCNDPSKYADDTATNYTLLSYSGSTAWSSSYITKEGVDSNYPSYIMPTEAGGTGASDTTYMCDVIRSATGWKVLIVSGDWTFASASGITCTDVRNVSSISGTSIGSRLLYIE